MRLFFSFDCDGIQIRFQEVTLTRELPGRPPQPCGGGGGGGGGDGAVGQWRRQTGLGWRWSSETNSAGGSDSGGGGSGSRVYCKYLRHNLICMSNTQGAFLHRFMLSHIQHRAGSKTRNKK